MSINITFKLLNIDIENISIGPHYNYYIDSRIVVSDSLFVREKPSMKSEIIEKLYFREQVYVAQEKENWINIIIPTKDNNFINGWVKKDGIGRINIE